MHLTREQKSIIERVINCFESGEADGDYGCISIYADGPHGVRQITYGRSQTTEYGNLRQLVQMYAEAEGTYSQELRPYSELVGSVPLVDDLNFRRLLREGGREDQVMRAVQDRFFESSYFEPAMKWADQHMFVLPLSALVVYDSFIHSGSILWLIRQRFPENPPDLGGDEKVWTRAYVRERQKWLGSSDKKAVRNSVYRTNDLTRLLNADNWQLDQLPIMAHGVAVYPKGDI